MSFIPEWAPNIHPVLIHFPIVLLILAPMLDASAIIFRKERWLPQSANLVYALAGLSLLAVYITGRFAADSVDIPTQAYRTLSIHADWALYTLISGGINAVFRGTQLLRNYEEHPFQWFLIIPGLVVASLLFFTADNGAKLVYAHGVGVTVLEQDDHHSEAEVHSHESSADDSHHDGIDYDSPSQTSETELKHYFEWILGDVERIEMERTHYQGQDASRISVNLDDQEALFVLPESYSNVEYLIKLNRDNFNGIIRLVHHVTSSNNYDFLEVGKNSIMQGRMASGNLSNFDTAKITVDGWINLKIVSTKGHFRGYVDQNLVTHGHGKDLPSGKIGIFMKGSGEVKFVELSGTEIE